MVKQKPAAATSATAVGVTTRAAAKKRGSKPAPSVPETRVIKRVVVVNMCRECGSARMYRLDNCTEPEWRLLQAIKNGCKESDLGADERECLTGMQRRWRCLQVDRVVLM